MVMKLRIPAPDWGGAKCLDCPAPDRELDLWFGEFDGGQSLQELMDEAAGVCNGIDNGRVCPRRHDCLVFALTNNEASGVWGGMHEDDLKYMRNHVPPEEWKWRPPLPVHVKEQGAEERARKLKAA